LDLWDLSAPMRLCRRPDLWDLWDLWDLLDQFQYQSN